MKKILILAGGYSKEKEVSIQTAKSVYSELNKDKKYKIFGEGGVENTANEFNKDFLGQIPLNQDLRNSADIGEPLTHSQPDHEVSKIFKSVAEKIKLSFL